MSKSGESERMAAMNAITCNGMPVNPGVVTSGTWGHYVGATIIDMAMVYGWQDADAERAASEYGENYWRADWQYADAWDDMVGDAESWLNDNTDGGIWHMSDGDFRLDETGRESGEIV